MKYCAHCGTLHPAEQSLCPACGAALAAPPAEAPAAETTAAQPASAEAAADGPDPGTAPVGEAEAAAPRTDGTPDEPAAPAAPAPSRPEPEAATPAAAPAPAGEAASEVTGAAPAPASAAPADGRIRFEQPAAAHAAPAPRYGRVLPQQPDGGLTTAQYFWTLVLFGLPLVGLGFMLYWSFGNTASPARRRLARACLIKAGVGFASAAGTLVLLAALLVGLAQNARYWYGHRDLYGYYEEFDGFTAPHGSPYDQFWDFFEENEPPRV